MGAIAKKSNADTICDAYYIFNNTFYQNSCRSLPREWRLKVKLKYVNNLTWQFKKSIVSPSGIRYTPPICSN